MAPFDDHHPIPQPLDEIYARLDKPVLMVSGTNTYISCSSVGIVSQWSAATLNTHPGSYGWDSSTSTYTVPKSGIYKVTAHFQYTGASITDRGQAGLLYKDGVLWARSFRTFQNVASGTEYFPATVSAIASCVGGSTTFQMRHAGLAGLSMYMLETRFMVECIEVL